jgi:uncharacterized protein (TIGR00725 family)
MSFSSVKGKPKIVGVMGSHRDNSPSMNDARLLGKAIAQRGHILLTGGGPGVMKAASEGAHNAGGLVIGILPTERKRPLPGYPNEFVDVPIYTGMYDARNIINAKTPHVIIAVGGGPGTLSEMAIAVKSGTPVIGLHAPAMECDDDTPFTLASSVEEALQKMDKILSGVP